MIAATALILIFLGASCSKNNGAEAPPVIPGPTTDVKITSNATFGNIMTDGDNKTLYFFTFDGNGDSGCTGGCLVTWPIYYKENPALGTGLLAADFGVITRKSDGKKQSTYKGWPLYYYVGDTKAGTVTGDGAESKTWFVAKADYMVMLASAPLIGTDGKNYIITGAAGTDVTQYITDALGRTLYNFNAKDTFKKNNFSTGTAADNTWPIYNAPAGSIPSALDKTQFETTTVAALGGATQVTYKGRPLYYFGADAATRGNTKGVSFPMPGGIWRVNNTTTTALTAM